MAQLCLVKLTGSIKLHTHSVCRRSHTEFSGAYFQINIHNVNFKLTGLAALGPQSHSDILILGNPNISAAQHPLQWYESWATFDSSKPVLQMRNGTQQPLQRPLSVLVIWHQGCVKGGERKFQGGLKESRSRDGGRFQQYYYMPNLILSFHTSPPFSLR